MRRERSSSPMLSATGSCVDTEIRPSSPMVSGTPSVCVASRRALARMSSTDRSDESSTHSGAELSDFSALVTFELFVRPFIRSMLDLVGDGRLHVRAMPETRMEKDVARRAFLRVRVWHEEGDIHARAAGGQASSQLRPMADANALLIVPEGQVAAETHLGYEAIVFEPMLLQSWR